MSFPSPHTGHTQSSGKSSNGVPGFTPAFSFPNFGLYIYLHCVHSYLWLADPFSALKFLYPNPKATITISKNDNAFHIPLSINITANIPNVALIPYNINTACFWLNPLATILWCKCPLSALNIAFIDFPFINLLIIAHSVSNIGSPKTINGKTITAIVYVFATPNIDIIDNEYPKKFEPVSPINVLAGVKLNGKNPTKEPAKAAINIIDTKGDPLSTNIINNDTADITDIPADKPI